MASYCGHPEDCDCERCYSAARADTAHKQGQEKALRYIDGWIDSKLALDLTPGARAILDDMRVHIRAAILRIEHGERMEATTPIVRITP